MGRILKETPEATKALWRFDVIVHVFYLVIFGLFIGPLDAGYESKLWCIYAITVLGYFAVRSALATTRGYPVLSVLQRTGLAVLPLWGPVEMFAFFRFGQVIRYGHRAVLDGTGWY
jgi:hypothetical protein